MTRLEFFVGSLAAAALFWAASTAAQEEPILRIEGRVTHVSPWEMLVEIDDGPVVMLDVSRIPQGQLSQISQNDYVAVTGFIRRPSHKIFATEIRRGTPWIPTVPRWAPQSP
jgi:hypothetical protein